MEIRRETSGSMVVTLELRATQNGVIWPRRPLVSSKGLLSSLQNVPHSSCDRKPTGFRDVAFNASGDVFAATDDKGRVFVFFVSANRYALAQHLGSPTVACCFSPTRKSELLVTCENEMIRCLDVHANSLISSLRGHRSPARSASFQKSGDLALTASRDAVILWDTKDWSRYRVLNAGPGVEEATFVTKGDLVAVCFQDDSIMMWELDSLALRYRFALPEHEKPGGLRKIAVSDDCKILVATGRSRFIYVWDFESQTIIRIIELPPPIEEVRTFSFAPGYESMICLLDNEGCLFFLDVAAKKPKITLEISQQGRKISSFDIENHGRYLVASTDDGCLLLYDLDIAKETAQRSHALRKEQGLEELEENLQLRTRSVLRYGRVDVQATEHHSTDAADGDRPAFSKLIDGIFGSKARQGREAISGDNHDGQDDAEDYVTGHTHGVFSPRVLLRATAAKSTTVVSGHVSKRQTIRSGLKQKSPLQMAKLSDEEIELNRKRLENSLQCSGKYPSKYRLIVWKFLLGLPKNEAAFKALATKGPHPAHVTLHEEYPLKNRRHLRRLHRVLSAIAYWCPAFGEVGYLPAVVYPFIKMYRENDVAAFEASLCVLLHWCRDFLVSLPHPPVLLLSSIHSQVEKIDPQLYDHFVKHNISAEIYAWSLLKSIFTEVLNEDEWMCLWDHLFTASAKPWLLYVAVLAYVVYFRTALLAAKDRFSIEQFFYQQNALQIQSFVRLMLNLSEKVGDFPRKEFKNPAAVKDINESTATRTYWPLPKGQYPAFANYPKFVVDFQISERNRIALEEAELLQKKNLLKRVEVECGKLKEAHEKWLQERRMLVAAEEKRHKELLAAEKGRIMNLRTLDHETRKRRLERLAELEQAAKESLEQTSKLFEAEFLRLQSEVDIVKERSEYEILARQQEEELQRLEFETEKRVVDIHKQREVEERLQQLRTEFVTRIKQDELQDLLAFERWKRDDEAQRLSAKLEIERREKLARLQQERTVRQQLEDRLLDHVLEKEQQFLDLQTQRETRVKEEKAGRSMTQQVDELEQQLSAELHTTSGTHHGRRDGSRKKSVTVQDPTDQQRQRPPSRNNQRGHGSATPHEAPSRGTTSRPPLHKGHASNAAREEFDHDDNDPDGAAHVTRESLRMLDTARRRLSSVLHPSNESHSSHSSSRASSFTSAPITRTQEEITLLEKALADVSGSSSNGDGDDDGGGSVTDDAHQASENHSDLFRGISPIRGSHQSPHISLADATALLRDDSAATLINEGLGAISGPGSVSQQQQQQYRASSSSLLSSDEDGSSMLQRPIEELEEELGIRFGGYSDEEKEGDSDEEEDEDDSELEEDRELLLQRAKKLLAESSFLADGGSDDE